MFISAACFHSNRYNATYQKQKELDEKLARFVQKLRRLFEGQNVVQEQLGSKLNIPRDVTMNQYCEPAGQDEVAVLFSFEADAHSIYLWVLSSRR